MREDVPALTDAPDARAPATPTASTEESRRRLIVEALGIAASAIGFGFVYGLSAREAGFSPLDQNERWWVWKCPTPGCAGLLHATGYAFEKHAVYTVCDGTCAKTFLR